MSLVVDPVQRRRRRYDRMLSCTQLSEQQQRLLDDPRLLDATSSLQQLKLWYGGLPPEDALKLLSKHNHVRLEGRLNTLKHRLTRPRYNKIDHIPELLSIHDITCKLPGVPGLAKYPHQEPRHRDRRSRERDRDRDRNRDRDRRHATKGSRDGFAALHQQPEESSEVALALEQLQLEDEP